MKKLLTLTNLSRLAKLVAFAITVTTKVKEERAKKKAAEAEKDEAGA